MIHNQIEQKQLQRYNTIIRKIVNMLFLWWTKKEVKITSLSGFRYYKHNFNKRFKLP